MYPSEIVTRDDYSYVKINYSKKLVNINFLNSIKNEDSEDLYDSILANIEPKILTFSSIGSFKRTLEKGIDDLNAEDILLYPDLVNESKLKRLVQPKNLKDIGGFKLISSIGFGVMKRSNSTQGIISELNDLGKTKEYSAPLQYLFDGSQKAKPELRLSKGRVPAVLSTAQNQIIESVNSNYATLVIGPPGTGKSFSIAALALEFMSKGKSVLIASKTDQAVDVIHKKIEKDLGMSGVAFRAGKSDYKRQLKDQLNNLLLGTRKRPDHFIDPTYGLDEKLVANYAKIEELQSQFEEQVIKELDWGKYLSEKQEDPSLWAKIKFQYIKWRNSRQTPHWELNKFFLEAVSLRITLTKEFVEKTFNKQVHQALYSKRAMFRDFWMSLSVRTSSRQDQLFRQIDIDYILKTFPIWLVNMADIYEVFPLEKERFDLAIIDEATQCDIASCLPIIQRAKRVVIVGDPKQLRHVSFLSRSVQMTLQKKNKIGDQEFQGKLDFRNTSILDLLNLRIENQNQVCFLDEHFRSKPELIAFSNKYFYDGSLRIMTSLPEKDSGPGMVIIDSQGKKDDKGVNKKEADDLILKIKSMINEQIELDESVCQSIGVLSPFRDQVEYLGKRLSTDIDLIYIEKHQIRCGTAYSFQGEERDVMMISLAIDDNAHHSAVIHLNKPDVFNVSITRARSEQYFFKSFGDQYDPGKYLRKLLSDLSKQNNSSRSIKTKEVRDLFLNEVRAELSKQEIQAWISFSTSGLLVDIAFKRYDKFYGINLIGYPGNFVDALTIDDYKILNRAGLPTFSLPYTYWSFDKDKCFEELMRFSEMKLVE